MRPVHVRGVKEKAWSNAPFAIMENALFVTEQACLPARNVMAAVTVGLLGFAPVNDAMAEGLRTARLASALVESVQSVPGKGTRSVMRAKGRDEVTEREIRSESSSGVDRLGGDG